LCNAINLSWSLFGGKEAMLVEFLWMIPSKEYATDVFAKPLPACKLHNPDVPYLLHVQGCTRTVCSVRMWSWKYGHFGEWSPEFDQNACSMHKQGEKKDHDFWTFEISMIPREMPKWSQ
jgi:hypothetical protein